MRCGQRLAVVLAQIGATGPAGGDEAVEMGPPLGGRALDQRQPVGREDRDRRAVARRDRRVDGGAVEQVAATLGPRDRGEQAVVGALRGLDIDLGARQVGPERDQLAPVAVRNERPVSAK